MHANSGRCLVIRDGATEGAAAILETFLDGEGDPFAASRSYHLCDAGLRYGAGLAVSEACDILVDRLPHSEFTTIWEGEIVLNTADGAVLALRAGDSAVIPAGAWLRWRQNAPVKRSFVVFPDAADDGGTDVVKIDPAVSLEPGGVPAASVLLSAPPPKAANRRLFQARDGRVRIGLWQCTPYERRAVKPPHSEFMHILTGSVTITEQEGPAWTIRAGEAITVPAGAENRWLSDESVHKVFCIVS